MSAECHCCGAESAVDPDCPRPTAPDAPHLLHHTALCTLGRREHFVLACGCQGWKAEAETGGRRTFVYVKCPDDGCTYYQFVLKESGEQQRPISIRMTTA